MYKKKLRSTRVFIVGVLLCLIHAAWADDESELLKADIRWTAYGVPHIKAENEQGLGYGIGYVYARDNACLLVEEIITARGERSRYFGAEGESSAHLNNLTSDFFFTWLNNISDIKLFWDAQPKPIQQLMQGYVVGFNQLLDEANVQSISCLNEPWLQSITHDDLVRLIRRMLVEGGVGQFSEAVVAASPPKSWWQWLVDKVDTVENKQTDQEPWNGALQYGYGSNAIAVGSQRSANGKGMLLANPHFPWHGALRFYQMHLTIPGQLNVMGAALPGMPLINIGFNQHMAWTHTVDTSSHFTLYRLEIDPNDEMRYIVDGQSYPLQKKTLQVQVRNDNGDLSTVSHNIYESKFGPLVTWPGMLKWNKKEAFALRDANLGNTRVLQQWYAINHAENAADLRASVESIQGIPWVNTIATDDEGHALYMNQSVVPHLLEGQLKECSIPELVVEGLPGLEGNRSACDWHIDKSAAQAGITPSAQMPILLRDDFVQNSNDSAWLTNPDSPIEGYSPLITRQGNELGLRARFALSRLQGNKLLTDGFLEKMVTNNQVYLADLVLDGILKLCSEESDNDSLFRACFNLERWDKRANVDSGLGYLYFSFVMDYVTASDNGWLIPFDPEIPLKTPSGIAINNTDIVAGIKEALVFGDETIMTWDIPDNARWGDIQVAGDKQLSIPGGMGELGVYNVIESKLQDGLLKVFRGSSYIQLVTFTDKGPQVKGLLAFSQSSDPLSKHYSDQTQLFSRQEWPILPFTEAQIEDDVALEQLDLQQQ